MHLVVAVARLRARSLLNQRETLCVASVLGAYLAIRVWSFADVFGHGASFVDTSEYVDTSRLPLFGLDFWTWYKPWGAPLFWKLLPGSVETDSTWQWLLSCVAWATLAVTVYRVLWHPVVKWVGFGVVLAFSLAPAVAVWDGALLSESVALSAGALLVSALLLLLEEPTRLRTAAVLLVAVLLAGTRASNGYVLLFALLPVAICLARRNRGSAGVLAAGAVGIALFTYATSNVRQWEVALAEIIAGRVLHEPAAETYFVDHGMPIRPTLEAQLWAHRLPPYSDFETNSELAWFRPWFNQHARPTYRDYLISHPSKAIVTPVRKLPSMISPSTSKEDLQGLPLDVFEAKGYRAALPRILARLAYPASASLLLAWAAAAIVAAVGFAAMGARRWVWVVPLLGLISAPPHGVVLWDGSDTNIGRHALLLAVFFRLSLILMTLFLADEALRRRSRGSRHG